MTSEQSWQILLKIAIKRKADSMLQEDISEEIRILRYCAMLRLIRAYINRA